VVLRNNKKKLQQHKRGVAGRCVEKPYETTKRNYNAIPYTHGKDVDVCSYHHLETTKRNYNFGLILAVGKC
jgi:hypothetical protein